MNSMTNTLLVYPKNPKTFWSYNKALAIAGKKSMFPPTGLLTIASDMPEKYNIRLIDENIRKLKDSDLEWSDIIITSSMGIHKKPLEKIIERANEYETPIFAGGPLPTQYHDRIKGNATFFLGESEAGFLEELEAIVRKGYVPERNVVDKRKIFNSLNHTPIQRFELLKKDLNKYQVMALQLTRGCPEHCTFCNIASLYGNKTRLKEKGKLLTEMDILYDLGWRGSVMIVDDNVAGNQEALIPILNDVAKWQKERKYPFSFFTQASLRIFDNKELMEAMYNAGFNQVFFGIESPSVESLKFMGAQKNIQDRGKSGLSIVEKLRYIGENYFKPQAGFIIGFDKDPDNISEMMIDLIMKGRISVAMVGPLGILPDTIDYERYAKQDRLIKNVIYSGDSGMFSRQLSFIPQDNLGNTINPDVVTDRLRNVLENINSPEKYFSRTQDYILSRKRKALANIPVKPSGIMAAARSIFEQGIKSNYRSTYWRYMWNVARNDVKDIPDAISYAVEGHHLISVTRETLKVDDVNKGIEKLLADFEPMLEEWKEKGQEYKKKISKGYKKTYHNVLKKYHKIKMGLKEEVKGLDNLKEKYNDLFKKKTHN